MGILKLGLRLTASCTKRILLFVCLTALLCVAAGLLGNYLLYGGAMDPVTIALVDEDNSFESRMLLNYLEDYDDYREVLRFVRTDEAAANAMLESGEATAAIQIPPEFVAGVMDGRNNPFTITLSRQMPMKAALVRVFADVYADMLQTGQQGIYTALSATRDLGTDEQYREMYRTANLRYLSAILNRLGMQAEREVSATGGSAAAYYSAAALVFLLLLGSILFLDVWAGASSREVLLRLAAKGNNPAATGLMYVVTGMIPFLAAGILLAAGIVAANLVFDWGIAVSLPLGAALLVLVLCSGAFMVAAARLFGGGASGSVFVFVFSCIGLFLSGGVLPTAYLAPLLAAAGKLTPHYWLSALLRDGMAGTLNAMALMVSLVFALLFAAIAVLSIAGGGKARRQP